MSKSVKIFAIVVGIIVVAILAFTYLGNNAPVADTSGLSSTAGTTATAGGTPSSSFIQVLSTVNTISLDTSIFSNAGYKALRDYPVSLGTAVIGRDNPFAPIGTDSSSGTTAAAPLQVQTLAASKVTSTTADIGALVTNGGSTATVVFQYGLSDMFGSSTAPVKVTASGTAVFSLTALTPATTYYVEAVAVQGSTTATGTIMTFTTAAAQKR